MSDGDGDVDRDSDDNFYRMLLHNDTSTGSNLTKIFCSVLG